MDRDAERQLVKRCQSGDWGAFEALFQEHWDRAYRLAFRITGSHADADDLLQEAWVKAYRGISGFRGDALFVTWFFRILLRAAADYERRRATRPAILSLGAAVGANVGGADGDPAVKATESELDDLLRRAIGELPYNLRCAIVLVAMEDMSYTQVAETLNCSLGSVSWRVAEGRRRLAEKLGPHLSE